MKLKSLTTIDNIHPGEVLNEEFLVPMGITPYRLAKETGMPESRISSIIHGRRGITADTAIRLSRFLGTSPEFWLNLQNMYDLEKEEKSQIKSYNAIVRFTSNYTKEMV